MNEKLKKEVEKLENKCLCIFILFKNKDKELEYFECWDIKVYRIIIFEGSFECIRCDVLICFLDENC